MAKEKEEEKKREKRPTAKKRDLQNERKRLQNKAFKARVNTALRSFEKSAAQSDSSGIQDQLSQVYSLMDKGVKTGIYKKNKANRVKSKLTKRTKARKS